MAVLMDLKIQEVQQQIEDFRLNKQAEVDNLMDEIAQLREQLKDKRELVLPSEIITLRDYLSQLNDKMAQNAQKAVEYAKQRQCKLNDIKVMENKQKYKKGRTYYTGRYLISLKAEKRRLEEEFLVYQKQFIELQEELTKATYEELTLKRQLVYRELSDSSSSDVFDYEKMAENLYQVEQQQNTDSRLNSRSTMRTQNTAFSCRTYRSTASLRTKQNPPNKHALCYRRLYVIKNRTNILRNSIYSLKSEFQPVIQQVVQSLRECECLEAFLDNGELALSESQKEELAAHLASDEAFVGNLIRICCSTGIRGVTKGYD